MTERSHVLDAFGQVNALNSGIFLSKISPICFEFASSIRSGDPPDHHPTHKQRIDSLLVYSMNSGFIL